MKRWLCLLACLILCFGCTKSKINRKVIQMEDVVKQMKDSNIKDESLFRGRTPAQINEDEIRIVDSLLIDGVERFNMKQRESERTIDDLIEIESYHCNYIPTINEKGEKIILIIAKKANKDDIWWEVNEVLNIRDGYITVFWFYVNLSNKKGSNIRPNGQA